MPNFFYTDANGTKQGPLTPQQVKDLAAKGLITPETVMETDNGHKGKAGQIKGLFVNPPSPFTQVAPMPTVTAPAMPIPVNTQPVNNTLRTSGGNNVFGERNQHIAALLACFLGVFGVHWFYLGFQKRGIIYVCISIIGGILLVGIPTMVMGIIAFVEAVRFLICSPETFNSKYVNVGNATKQEPFTPNGVNGLAARGQMFGNPQVAAQAAPQPAEVPQPAVTDNIWTILTTKSITLAHAKQKARILGIMGLVGLVITVFFAVWYMLTQSGISPYFYDQQGGGNTLFFAILFGIPTLVLLFWAMMEWGAQDTACPTCKKLDAKKEVDREEKGRKKKVVKRSKYKNDKWEEEEVQVTEFKYWVTYQCPFCEHRWYDLHVTDTRDGWHWGDDY